MVPTVEHFLEMDTISKCHPAKVLARSARLADPKRAVLLSSLSPDQVRVGPCAAGREFRASGRLAAVLNWAQSAVLLRAPISRGEKLFGFMPLGKVGVHLCIRLGFSSSRPSACLDRTFPDDRVFLEKPYGNLHLKQVPFGSSLCGRAFYESKLPPSKAKAARFLIHARQSASCGQTVREGVREGGRGVGGEPGVTTTLRRWSWKCDPVAD